MNSYMRFPEYIRFIAYMMPMEARNADGKSGSVMTGCCTTITRWVSAFIAMPICGGMLVTADKSMSSSYNVKKQFCADYIASTMYKITNS